MFRVSTHTHTQTRTIYIILPYLLQFQTILVHFRFPIFDFRVSPRKLRALLNTQTNLMEATITLDHGKHLTKPKNEQKN